MRRSLDKGDMEHEKTENRSVRWLSLGVRATGGISAILGFVVLVGWYTHNFSLIQVMPNFVPMQFNTALGFLLCGVGLLSVEFRRSSLAVACGALVGVVGLLTLIQYVFGSDFGIDQLLMEHYITVKSSHPGRMAPNTALSFLLTGTALLTMAWPTRRNHQAIITGLLGSTITALGVVAFFGYLSGIESVYGWGHFTRMAVHTAFGFAVLGLGVLAFAWREGTAEDGSVPKWVPVSAVTASAIILLGMVSWWAVARVTADVQVETGEALSAVLETTQQALRSWYRANRAVAQSWGDSARLERLTQKLLATPPPRDALLTAEAQIEMREWLRPVYSREEYQGFFIIGPGNISLASMRDSNVGVLNLLSNQEDILEKMWSGQAALSLPQRSDVPLPDENGMLREGMPTMFVGSPIRDESGAVIALFTLRINPSKEFTAILQRGRIGESGETYAFDGRARLISESRYDDQLRDIGLIGPGERGILNVDIRDPGVNLVAGEATTITREQQPLTRMADRAVAGESGTDVKGYRDYRGVSVVGSWVWDSDLGLGIATEIDTREAYGTLVSIQTIIFALTVFSMLLLFAVTAVFMASHKRILQNENRTRTILETALDAVIGMDDSGTITHWNSQAEQTFGWSREETVGRRLKDTIIPQRYREAYERGLRHFLTTGEGPMLNKRIETTALHSDGHEFPIELTITSFRTGKNYAFNAFARDITERKQLENSLRELSAQLLRSQDAEQRRIARELHDTTAQSIAALSMNLDLLREQTPSLAPNAQELISECLTLAHEASREIRSLSYLLHPPTLDEMGLASALSWYTEGFTKRSKIRVDLEVAPDLGRLPQEIELTLFRIAQESLRNINRHSGSPTAKIRLFLNSDTVGLEVSDEGRGIPPDALRADGKATAELSVGIRGMRERMWQLGGKLDIKSTGQGTTITAVLPVPEG